MGQLSFCVSSLFVILINSKYDLLQISTTVLVKHVSMEEHALT